MNPRVTDNDKDEITVSLEGKELRGWSYANDAERRQKMLMAREFVEGWFQASAVLHPQLDAVSEKLNLANTGGLSLFYDIRRELGWNDKTALSILPSGVRRIRHALATWDTPTGMELEALALAVKSRVLELERIQIQNNARITELTDQLDQCADHAPGK